MLSLLTGVAIIANRTRCAVEIRNGKLCSRDRFLLYNWTRTTDAAAIERLRLSSAAEGSGGIALSWLGEATSALVAETTDGASFAVAAVYPHELLTRLAEELAPRLEADLESTERMRSVDAKPDIARESSRTLEIVSGASESEEPAEPMPEEPAGTNITIERREEGISIRVPPAGLWKGSKGLFLFAVLWNGFCSIFVVFAVLGALGIVEGDGDLPSWALPLFILPFIAVGVGITLVALNMGRRHAEIVTAYDALLIIRHTIFGKKVAEWAAEQIAEIGVGSSGMEVNDVPVMELQVLPRDGKKFGCLSQLDAEELDWIAGELNAALPLVPIGDASTAERDESGDVVVPEGSRVTLQGTPAGIRINVPPRGMRDNWGALIVGSVFATVGVAVTTGVVYSNLKDGFEKGDLMELFFIGLWGSLFVGAGLAVLIWGIVAARRDFQITVQRGELAVLRTGPFGRRTFRWPLEHVEAFEVADSDTQVNNQALRQIKIKVLAGSGLGMMTGHPPGDLATVTAAVNDAIVTQS